MRYGHHRSITIEIPKLCVITLNSNINILMSYPGNNRKIRLSSFLETKSRIISGLSGPLPMTWWLDHLVSEVSLVSS